MIARIEFVNGKCGEFEVFSEEKLGDAYNKIRFHLLSKQSFMVYRAVYNAEDKKFSDIRPNPIILNPVNIVSMEIIEE